MKFQTITCLASLAGVVIAHGGVFSYRVDDVFYEGNTWLLSDLHGGVVPTPNPPTAPSIQRRWFYDPIYNTSSPNMTCNYDGAASLSPLHAPIKAGGEIFTNWTNPSYYSWPDDWQHTVGPMFAYMAACPGESCEGFDGSGAVWFKIDQQGLTPDAPDLRGMWEQRPAINQNWNEREGYTVTIPKNLKPGNYLIRHEVIMLVSVQAQIYPSCAQLSVSGDGAAVPGDEYLVSFPGAYSPEDPGLAMADVSFGYPFTPELNTTVYPFPGPALWTGE